MTCSRTIQRNSLEDFAQPLSPSRRKVLGLALTGALLGGTSAARAQAPWPSKPIRFIVGFSAGGPTDTFARLLARKLSDQLGQPVAIENRVGANANIAAEAVARSESDGYTFLYNSSSLATSASLYRNLRYDAKKDLLPVGMTMSVPIAFVVHPSVPVGTPTDLVEFLKAQQGKVTYASGGIGNAQHLGMEMLLRAYGVQASHIPYKGSSQAHLDLVAGRTSMMIDTVGSVLPYIRDQRLRALATLSLERLPTLPDVPTIAESGLPGFELEAWQGVMAPANTHESIVNRMNVELAKALMSDEVKASLSAQSGRARTGSPRAYDQYLRAEIERYARVINELNITID